jgi:hypothetical protein
VGTFRPGFKPGVENLFVGGVNLFVKITPVPEFVGAIPDGVVDAGYWEGIAGVNTVEAEAGAG